MDINNLKKRVEELRLMNAAGECKYMDQVEELARAAVTDITVGAITTQPSRGNEGEVFWVDEETGRSLNSLALPNPGAVYYRQYLPYMVKVAHDAGKRLRVNIAGEHPEDYKALVELCAEAEVDETELNTSCPNTFKNGVQQGIIAFAPTTMSEILRLIDEDHEKGEYPPVSVKMPPYADPALLARVARICKASACVSAVVASNTFPNALAFDKRGRPRIAPHKGLGGFGGAGFKEIALGQVFQFREELPEKIAVIGSGGIRCGEDVLHHMLAGVSGVQVGTHYFQYADPRIFTRLSEELLRAIEEMEELNK